MTKSKVCIQKTCLYSKVQEVHWHVVVDFDTILYFAFIGKVTDENTDLRSNHYVNVIVAGKHPAPQWLNMEQAVEHCTRGIGIWNFASNDQEAEPDMVMGCSGLVPTLEVLAAVSILREHLPEVKIRVINVVDLFKLEKSTEHTHGLTDADYNALFTTNKPVVFAFHG